MADLHYTKWAERIATELREAEFPETKVSIIAAALAEAYCDGNVAGHRWALGSLDRALRRTEKCADINTDTQFDHTRSLIEQGEGVL